MKVKELIEKLKQCTEEAEVVFLTENGHFESIIYIEEDQYLSDEDIKSEVKMPRVVLS